MEREKAIFLNDGDIDVKAILRENDIIADVVR